MRFDFRQVLAAATARTTATSSSMDGMNTVDTVTIPLTVELLLRMQREAQHREKEAM
jgi:hypothetical protein